MFNTRSRAPCCLLNGIKQSINTFTPGKLQVKPCSTYNRKKTAHESRQPDEWEYARLIFLLFTFSNC